MPWTNYPNGVSLSTATGTTLGVINGATSIDCSAGTVTVASVNCTGSIVGAGNKQWTSVALDSGGGTRKLVFPYDVALTDVILGCSTVGSTAVGLSINLGTAAAAVFTSTSAFSFASVSGYQKSFTITGNSVFTAGLTSVGFYDIVMAAGAGTTAFYTVNIGYNRI